MKNIDTAHSEYLTRKIKIDKILQSSGWKIVEYNEKTSHEKYRGCAVTEYPTKSGPVDYALFDGGQPIAVVEAKKSSLSAYTVLDQAQRYAKGIDADLKFGEYGVPFAYSTNGEKVFFQDLRDPQSYSREVVKFHSPNALEEMFLDKQKQGIKWLLENQRLNSCTRPYQSEAILAVEKALSEKKRKMLLAMATGTGKTFTTVQSIYRLIKSGFGKRILFLVDRRALAAQAVREFSTFEAEPGKKFDKLYEVYSQRFKREDFEDEKFDPKVLPKSYLTDPKIGQAFVYVCTIQRMRINLFGKEGVFEENDPELEEDAEKLDIPIHAFDIVIADECHRGYTSAEESKWREVLNYFDAAKIGLTATPAAHTTTYFENIVFRYEYSRAVREGYLVDYDTVAISSNVKLNGLFLKENESVGLVDIETGLEKLDRIEDDREFESTKIEREITSPESTKKIIEEFAKYALEQEKRTGRFPKTLIFAVNDLPKVSHADRVLKTCREIFGKGDIFVKKITGTVDRPLQRIREFRNRPEPGIVVTVDMLSTGVDIPSLENIVFLRPVKSRILFAQMLGRGTRRCDGIGKDRFVIYDCFGGSLLEYFSKATDLTIEPPDKPTRTFKDIIEDIYKNKDRRYNENCLIKRLQRIAKNMSGEAMDDFTPYVADGDISRFARELPQKLDEDFANTIKLLRNENFQEVLTNYPRKQKTFFVAYDSKDEVSSEYLFKTANGKEVKPNDYILAFERFVKENPERIQALKILLDRPSEWNTSALHEIKTKLKQNPYRFTVDNLRKAYHHELADIISIIKHAVKDEPLLSAEERVKRAIVKVTKGKKFTETQQQWIDLIKGHLVVNLAIEKDDFEKIPILARQGGWRKANKIFDGKMDDFLRKINGEIAK